MSSDGGRSASGADRSTSSSSSQVAKKEDRDDATRSEVSNASSRQALRIKSGSWMQASKPATPASLPQDPPHTDSQPMLSQQDSAQPSPAVTPAQVPMTPPRRAPSRAASSRHDDRMPWSPTKHSPGFFSPVAEGDCTHSPSITSRARSRPARTGEQMHNDSVFAATRREEHERAATAGLFHPDTSLRGARYMSKVTREKPSEPVFTRLYESRNKTNMQEQVARRLREERAECSGQPKICPSSAHLVPQRSAEMRLHWNEEKHRRISELREHEQMKEQSVLQSPTLNPNSLALASRNRRGRVEDRLISFGNKVKTERTETEIAERIKHREEANPHISAHAAMSASTGPAHERLYALHKERETRLHDRAVSEASNDDVCTFVPAISKRSHLLAGGDLPRHERVEDRLLRHGQEQRQRCEEQLDLLRKVEQESRKQPVGPLSRLLTEIAERSGTRPSYADPIGVDNERTAQELAAKHNQDLEFKPFIGVNSREIDRQLHGDKKLSWGERINNLYFKEQEKENKLQRLRGQKEEEEALRCRASLLAAERKAKVAQDVAQAKMGGGLHDRNKAWKQRLENKRRWGRHHQEEEEVRECTFKPAINRTSSVGRSSSARGRHASPRTRSSRAASAPRRTADGPHSYASPFSATPQPSPRYVSAQTHNDTDFVAREMAAEAARHETISLHIKDQLLASTPTKRTAVVVPPGTAGSPTPVGGGFVGASPAMSAPNTRALSLGSEFSDLADDNPDRLDLLRQFEEYRTHESELTLHHAPTARRM